jgi:RNA polymerase sigma-70 factor (ECF subfamily)
MKPEAEDVVQDALSDLVRRAQSGERAAQEEFACRALKSIRAIVQRRIGGKLREFVGEEDLAQTAMVEVIRDLPRMEYRGAKAFVRWLELVVDHKICDKAHHFDCHKRDKHREQRISDQVSSGAEVSASQIIAETVGPASRAGKHEVWERVRRAVQELPEPLRVVVIEREYNNRRLCDIGKDLGLSEGIVARRLLKAYAMLRRDLRATDY